MASISIYAEIRMMHYSFELFSTYEVTSNYLYLSLSSWYNFYTFSRPITNTLESALFSIAISNYKINYKDYDLSYLIYGGISVALRPTAIISYLPLYIYQFWTSEVKSKLLGSTIHLVLTILVGLLAFDCVWYRAYTVTIFNFIKVNIIDNVASSYGVHRFGWYTTQGMFVTCGVTYVLGIYGLYKCYNVHRVAKIYAASFLLTLLVLELGPHKEFRFIQNAIPIMCLFSAKAIHSFWVKVLSNDYQLDCVDQFNRHNLLFIDSSTGSVEVSQYFRRDCCGTKKNFVF